MSIFKELQQLEVAIDNLDSDFLFSDSAVNIYENIHQNAMTICRDDLLKTTVQARLDCFENILETINTSDELMDEYPLEKLEKPLKKINTALVLVINLQKERADMKKNKMSIPIDSHVLSRVKLAKNDNETVGEFIEKAIKKSINDPNVIYYSFRQQGMLKRIEIDKDLFNIADTGKTNVRARIEGSVIKYIAFRELFKEGGAE